MQDESKEKANDLDSQISDLFNQIDLDKNGTLDIKEMKRALISLGISPTVEEMKNYFQMFDFDDD